MVELLVVLMIATLIGGGTLLGRRFGQVRQLPGWTAIASFRDRGKGKIRGRVELGGAALHAPLSGRRCACYEVVVLAGHGANPIEVFRERRLSDFFVVDETGRALIEVDGAYVVMTADWSTPLRGDRLDAYVLHHGVAPSPGLQLTEGVIEPGELIDVYGWGVREPDPDPRHVATYRDRPTRLVLRTTRALPVLVTDFTQGTTGPTVDAPAPDPYDPRR